ncbi:MAG TPA: hypothetical protein VLV49_15955 [Terriglobales bacterium]|nr:hypothetical protein [Terriglobales bacterium]
MAGTIKTAFGTYSSGVDLHALVGELNEAGLSAREVCVLLPLIHPAAQTLRALRAGELTLDDAPEVETVLRWVGKFGAVVIPGVGLFVSGRDFAGILHGAAEEDDNCRSVLSSLGLSAREVWRYEDWVHSGGVVVYVCCDDAGQVRQAGEILEAAGSAGARPLDVPQTVFHWQPQAVAVVPQQPY